MKKIIKTIILFVWLALIYYFSSQTGSQSGGLSTKILAYIGNILKVEDIENFVNSFSFIIRKGAHFTEHFILFILTYECFKEYKIDYLLLVSILFCLLSASFDECHQLLIPGRSGQFSDVLIDFSGSLFSYLIWHKLIKK